MEVKIIQSIHIRLADGRSAHLKLTIQLDNLLEIAITTDDSAQEKIFSKKFEDQERALDFFEYLKEDRDVPEPVGKYKKLASDLEKARIYAESLMGDDDSGPFNFDSAYIYLPRWRKKLVINAAKTAGLDCFKDGRSSRYLFCIPGTECFIRTRAVKAMRDFLEDLGYCTGVFYMLD